VHVYTRIVVLDVVVTDAKGQPVTDLNRNDFTVVEDNQPQRIRSFDPPAMHALPPGEIVHSTGDLVHIGNAPVNILVLDELNTPSANTQSPDSSGLCVFARVPLSAQELLDRPYYFCAN
jgi:VWFA-related protein